MKRIVMTVLTGLLLLTAASAAEWYDPYLEIAADHGLMEGTGAGMDPLGTLTEAQGVILAARLHHLLNGGDGVLPPAPEDWRTVRILDAQGRPVLDPQANIGYSASGGELFLWFPRTLIEPLGEGPVTLVANGTDSYTGKPWQREDDQGGETRWGLLFTGLDPYYAITDAINDAKARLYGPAWAMDAVYYVDQHELFYITPWGLGYPEYRASLLTKLEAVVPKEDLAPINEIEELPDVAVDQYWISGPSGRTEGDFASFYRAGIVTGTDAYGTFRGGETVTRAEAATLLARILEPGLRQRFTLEPMTWDLDYTLTPLGVDEAGYWAETVRWSFPGGYELEDRILRVSERRGGEVDYDRDGIMGIDGAWIVEPGRYGEIGPFLADGIAQVATTHYLGTAKYGFIDRQGRELVPPVYDSVGGFHDGVLLAWDGKAYTVFDAAGTAIGTLPDTVWGPAGVGEGLAVCTNGAETWDELRYGYMDLSGQVVLPPVYDEAGVFSQGLAAVERDGRVGFIDRTGAVVIDFRYAPWDHEPYRFQDGVAAVGVEQDDGTVLYGLIDQTGTPVTEARYQSLDLRFTRGWASFMRAEGYAMVSGFLSPSGEERFIPCDPTYQVFTYCQGYAAVGSTYGGMGYADESGRLVTPLIFSDLTPIVDGKAIVQCLDGAFYRLEVVG